MSPQVYQPHTGHYLCRNKYYGRGLSSEGFRQALQQYMHNGKGLRRDLFEPILSKLRSLKAVLERQASYRFYSSSLLIIYEGKVSRIHTLEGRDVSVKQLPGVACSPRSGPVCSPGE